MTTNTEIKLEGANYKERCISAHNLLEETMKQMTREGVAPGSDPIKYLAEKQNCTYEAAKEISKMWQFARARALAAADKRKVDREEARFERRRALSR